MKKMRRQAFTLVELLVSMAVFSILVLVMMQMFTGAQQLWVASESRNALYADARVAMDLIATQLQCNLFSNDSPHFYVAPTDGDGNNWIYFTTKSPMKLQVTTSLDYFVAYKLRTSDRTLRLASIGDNDTPSFKFLFSKDSGTQTAAQVQTTIGNLLDSASDGNTYCAEVIGNVIGLKLTPYVRHETTGLYALASVSGTLPYAVEIELRMLSAADAKKYDVLPSSARAEFLTQKQQIFRRMVFLGDAL